MAKLIFKTDFENVTRNPGGGINFNDVNGNPVDNGFNPAGNAELWIEGLDKNALPIGCKPYSGTRCLGVAVNSVIEEEHRAELNIILPNDIGNEYYFKAQVFLTSDFKLDTSNEAIAAGNYFSLANPHQHQGDYVPQIELEIHLGTNDGVTWNGQYDIVVTRRDANAWFPNWAVYKNFPLKSLLGKWFPIEWHVNKSTGMVKVWVNRILVCSNSSGSLPSTGQYISIPKCYYGTVDKIPKSMWIDDMELWDGMPTPAPPNILPALFIGGALVYLLTRRG